MSPTQRRELGSRERGRLILALVVLTAFAVLSAGGIAVEIHNYSETLDSLEHWQARLEEEAEATERPPRATGFDAPAARVRRLEEELAAIPGRLFALGSVFVLMTVLVALGYRVLRHGRRVA